MTETQLQASIIKALEQMGVWVIRTAVSRKRSRGRTGEPGMPDLCLVDLGHGWLCAGGWLEVKLPGKELEPAQVAWAERAASSGVRCGVAHSIKEALVVLKRFRADAED